MTQVCTLLSYKTELGASTSQRLSNVVYSESDQADTWYIPIGTTKEKVKKKEVKCRVFSLYFHFSKMLQNFYFKIQKKSQLFLKVIIPFKQVSEIIESE